MTKFVELEQGTEAWHKWRDGGVGGSDVPAIFNANPEGQRTRRDAFMQFAGFSNDKSISDYVAYMGHKTESILREMYLDKLGIDMPPVCVENGVFHVSLDGYNSKFGVAEFKQVGRDVFKKIEKGEVPYYHLLQVQTQLLATGAEKALYCAGYYDTKEQLKSCTVEIPADLEMQNTIKLEVLDFLNDVGEMKIPPLTEKDTNFITDVKVQSALMRMQELDEEIKKMKAIYEDYKELVLNNTPHVKNEFAGIKITRFERKGSVKYAQIPELKKLDKEYVETFRGNTTTQTKITFPKEKKQNG